MSRLWTDDDYLAAAQRAEELEARLAQAEAVVEAAQMVCRYEDGTHAQGVQLPRLRMAVKAFGVEQP